MNFTDYSRSDVCCYSSSEDNALLCNDKGGTTAISDLLFLSEAEPEWNTFMLTIKQIQNSHTLSKGLYMFLDVYKFIYDFEGKLKLFWTESQQNRH